VIIQVKDDIHRWTIPKIYQDTDKKINVIDILVNGKDTDIPLKLYGSNPGVTAVPNDTACTQKVIGMIFGDEVFEME